MKCKVYEDFVYKLDHNEIFVFGSNEGGKHGKGAAKTAVKFGAIYGIGYGIQGKTYGIPTKNKNLKVLKLSKIEKYVQKFIKYVKNNEEKHFIITKIGCGLAGFKEKEIAPLFEELIDYENVSMPKDFMKYY